MPSPTYARNLEQLARAGGLNLSPRKRTKSLAIASGWLKTAGFPAKTPKGWVIAEVLEWMNVKPEPELENIQHPTSNIQHPTGAGADAAGAHESRITHHSDLFPPDAAGLKKILDLYQEKLFFPEKYPEDKIQVWQVKMLQQHRPWLFKSDEPAPAEKEATAAVPGAIPPPAVAVVPEALPDAESQKMLAILLARHFSGRIRIDISEQQISQWKEGHNLPPGVPLPPTKLGNRHSTAGWADWITQYLLPKYGRTATDQADLKITGLDVFQQAQQADAHRKIDEARKARLEADEIERKLSDKWIESAVATRAVAGLVNELCNWFRAEVEKLEPDRWREFCRERGVADDFVEGCHKNKAKG